MRHAGTVTAVVLACLVAVPALGRERGRREDRRAWDPHTVETVRGEVKAVERVSRPRQPGHRVLLVVATDAGEARVLLGPASYLDRQKRLPRAGDRVEVRGSRTTRAGRPLVIAAEVRWDGATLELRGPDGTPAWRTRR